MNKPKKLLQLSMANLYSYVRICCEGFLEPIFAEYFSSRPPADFLRLFYVAVKENAP